MNDIIQLDIGPDGAVFDFGDNDERLSRELDALFERYESGQLKPARYVTALREFITRHPRYIEADAMLGLALLDQDKPRQSLEAAQRGLRTGEKAIPADFRGAIDWRRPTNRGFLQCADAVARAHVALGEHREAARILEKMLAWNPADQQGAAYRIGSLYLRLGEKDKARAAFEATRDHPGSFAWYGLGLLHIVEGDFVAAATALRKAFVASPYPAELLCGAGALVPFVAGDAREDVEDAIDYAETEIDLWETTDQAMAFLRWLYHQPRAMLERAAIRDLRERRHWEKSLDVGDALEREEQALIAAIDDGLSAQIVRPREDREGRVAMPWLYIADQSAGLEAHGPAPADARDEPAWRRFT